MKWQEFLQDEYGNASMARLLVFLAFVPSAMIAVWIHTEASLSIFLGAYNLAFLISKGIDGTVEVKRSAANEA